MGRITPDNFHADPLGWGGNQCGHMVIGGVVMFIAAMVYLWSFGEYPQRWLIAAVVTCVYLAIELPQRGELFDTIEDITFAVGYSIAILLFPFREIAAGDAMLYFDPIAAGFAVSFFIGHMCIGMGIRELQRRDVLG